MKNFGRAFERHGVRYLLISGQATVLYGASQFSEDVDVWVEPTESNWRPILAQLRELRRRGGLVRAGTAVTPR